MKHFLEPRLDSEPNHWLQESHCGEIMLHLPLHRLPRVQEPGIEREFQMLLKLRLSVLSPQDLSFFQVILQDFASPSNPLRLPLKRMRSVSFASSFYFSYLYFFFVFFDRLVVTHSTVRPLSTYLHSISYFLRLDFLPVYLTRSFWPSKVVAIASLILKVGHRTPHCIRAPYVSYPLEKVKEWSNS